MHEFKEAIRECNLRDMGWNGLPFTWLNKRYEAGLIEEHLDRFLCNKSWGSFFHENAAETVVIWTLDHNLILMDFEEKGRKIRYERRSTRRIHYEDSWSSYDQCKQIVKREWSDQRKWSSAYAIENFKKEAKDSMAYLKLWSMDEFGGRKKKPEMLMGELKNRQLQGLQYVDWKKI